jgi:hypothetical protein
LTVKDVARLKASGVALEVPEMKAWLAKLSGSQRDEFIDVVGSVAGAVIDSVWDEAHGEGHGCRSPYCKAKG